MARHIHSASPPARLALALIALFSLILSTADQARATEGGTSHYIQGAYGDFLMGYLPGEGFYVRNDTIYMTQNVDQTLKGGAVYGRINAYTAMNLTKLSYIADVPAIGGYLGLAAGVPFILNTNVGGNINTFDTRGKRASFSETGDGNRGGLSDVFVAPVAGWNFGECHLSITPTLFFPTGYYSDKVITNLGMNYYSFDGNVAFTWLSKKGYEVSLNSGYMINSENTATKYVSGNQFHFDWTAAYHCNERFAFGLVGYAVAQTTPDSGSGASMGSYYSSGAGVGPIITYTLPILGKDVSVIAKWLHDLGGQNRLTGEAFYLSFALKF